VPTKQSPEDRAIRRPREQRTVQKLHSCLDAPSEVYSGSLSCCIAFTIGLQEAGGELVRDQSLFGGYIRMPNGDCYEIR
jgi:hypothetical protein